jgi:hypothetical protein
MCKSLNLTHRTSLAGVDTLPTDQGHSGPSPASMRHSRLVVEVKPQGRESGAPQAPGLRSMTSRGTIRIAVLCQSPAHCLLGEVSTLTFHASARRFTKKAQADPKFP